MLHLSELLGDGYDDLASHYCSASFKMHRYRDRHTHTHTQIDKFYGCALDVIEMAAVGWQVARHAVCVRHQNLEPADFRGLCVYWRSDFLWSPASEDANC